MNLDDYTSDDLVKELKKREEEEIEETRPQPLDVQDFSQVRKACEVHIQELIDGKVDSDIDHYIYETAMEAIYGKDIWNWVNSKLK